MANALARRPATNAPAGQSPAAPAGSPSLAVVPFTGAAHEHREPITTQTVTPGAGVARVGPFDVPAYGYLRHILIEVTAAGGVLGTGVLHPDFPFNLFTSLALYDVNGAPIFGPIDGFAALQANIWGGYGFRGDPRIDTDYVGTINGRFFLRIPVEISRHNGLGALANQNAAASYKLELTTNLATGATGLFTTAPTTVPTFTIKAWLESWSLPNGQDLAGRPQAQAPPAHGTSSYWSQFNRAGVGAGQLSLIHPRVGNLLRSIIYICRDATGARNDAVFPDPMLLMWDARVLTNESQNVRRKVMGERLVNGATRDVGVFVLPFNDSNNGQIGDEQPNFWLPTVQSTRLELQGVVATGGAIQVLTNDVAPVEVLPAARFVETSNTGFKPAQAGPVTV